MKGYKLFQALLSVLVVISCILLIYECLSIYLPAAAADQHDHIYSAEVVASHFAIIQLPVISCIVLSLAGALTAPWYKEVQKKPQSPDAETMAALYHSKMPKDTGEDSPEWNIVRRETARRRKLTTTGVVIAAICICWSLYFLINPKGFESLDFDHVAGSLLLCILPAVCLGIGSAAVINYKINDSWSRQLESMKILCKNNKGRAEMNTESENAAAIRSRRIFLARTVLLTMAVVFLLLGNANGGRADVLAKAIAICSECIGLG